MAISVQITKRPVECGYCDRKLEPGQEIAFWGGGPGCIWCAAEGRTARAVEPAPAVAPAEAPRVVVALAPWLAKKNGVLNEMAGVVTRETAKAIYFEGEGLATPTTRCRACGRALTHPVSVLYGIGPECGGHWHIAPQGVDAVEEIRKRIQAIRYAGWLPKRFVEVRGE